MHIASSRPARSFHSFVLLLALSLPETALAQPKPAPAAPPELPPKANAPAGKPAAPGSLDERLRSLIARPGGLTSDQAALRAANTSYEVRAREQELRAAAAEVDRALIAYFPRLTLTARYVRLSPIDQGRVGNLVSAPAAPAGPIDPATTLLVNVPLEFPVILNQYTLQANLTVPVSDYLLRTSQSLSAASRTREAAELQARATKLAAATQARVAYYGFSRARLQEIVAEQSVEQAKSHHEAARAAFDAGRVSRADVLRAESQLARAELLLERARNLATLTEDQLRTLIHDPLERRYEIGEDLLAPLPAEGTRQNPALLYAEALRKRLEIRALDRTEYSLREQRRAARAGYYPRFDAFGNAYYSNPNQRFFPQQDEWKPSWDVGVQLTWTPNDAGLAAAASSGLEARRAQVEAQKGALRDALRSEVMQSYQALVEAEASIGTTERGLVAAEEAYRVRRELFDYGRSTTVELIDAETELLRARLEMINARVDQRIARARLEHALGRDVGRR